MTSEQEYIAAIRANPDDDRLRHMAADWYDENGKPERAELIRVQMELESICKQWPSTPRSRELYARERTLLLGKALFSHFLLQLWRQDGRSFTPYTRGFIDHVGCSWPTWRDGGARLMEVEPVNKVTFHSRPNLDIYWPGPWDKKNEYGDYVVTEKAIIDLSPRMKRVQICIDKVVLAREIKTSSYDLMAYVRTEAREAIVKKIESLEFLGMEGGPWEGVKFRVANDRPDFVAEQWRWAMTTGFPINENDMRHQLGLEPALEPRYPVFEPGYIFTDVVE